GFAAWLVRDMKLSDGDALTWMEQWDVGNAPPKGRERLREIIANAHTYGQRGYGSGYQAPAAQPAQAKKAEGPTGYDVCLSHLHTALESTYRRDTSVFSAKLRRLVKQKDVIVLLGGNELIDKLADATDAPKDGNGIRRNGL